jgi:hypothetical protein
VPGRLQQAKQTTLTADSGQFFQIVGHFWGVVS